MPLHALSLHTLPERSSVTRAARVPSSALSSGLRTSDILTALSPTEWLVSDPSTAIGRSSAILGFIQLSGDMYEVTRIDVSVIEFSNFPSLTEAVAALSAKPGRRLNLVTAPCWRTESAHASAKAPISAKISRLPFNGRGQRELRHSAKSTAQ